MRFHTNGCSVNRTNPHPHGFVNHNLQVSNAKSNLDLHSTMHDALVFDYDHGDDAIPFEWVSIPTAAIGGNVNGVQFYCNYHQTFRGNGFLNKNASS